jgi:hypothetical protein
VSLQVAIMKVLSGHPDGCATFADMNADLAILTAVPDWTARMRRLAIRQPDLDVFSQGFVVRDSEGWTLTEAGFRMLETLERPGTADLPEDTAEPVSVAADNEVLVDVLPLPRIRQPKRVAARMRTSQRRRGHGLDRSA